jgi:site-specific DNA recombinase
MPRVTQSQPQHRESAMRLVGYVRVSTEEQATEGVSLDAQRERLAAYALAHNAELIAIESDEAVSGKVSPEKRSGLATALARIRSGEAEGLLVLKLDRLSRTTRDVLDLVDEAGARGWRLVSVSEHLDTGTAAGRLVLTVLAALSQMEREQVSERTRFALDAIGREGRGRSRRTPFGWQTADGESELKKGDRRRLVECDEEQQQLAALLRARKRGLGARRIAASLNRRFKTNPRTAKPWSPELVASLLRRLEKSSARRGPRAA